ncbi:MAG: PorV/PorQ family protein [Spirochaetes bacterium]|nr:PorV/PorQ family protein [Spirochaetota bacterium]
MRRANLLLMIIILFDLHLYAINNKTGSSAAQFLKIDPSAHSSAMGSASASFGQRGDSLFHNPAGLAQLNKMEVSVNYIKWFGDMNYSSASLAIPFKNIGTLGMGYMGLLYGDIPVVSFDTSGELASSGSTKASDMAFILSGSRNINILSLGANFKLISQLLEKQRTMGFAFDAGVHVALADRKFETGFMVQNVGQEIKFIEKGYRLPVNIIMGANLEFLDLEKHTSVIAVDVAIPDDESIRINMGLEYEYNNFIYIREGYIVGDDLSDFTTGGGVSILAGQSHIKLDYALIPYGPLGITHMVGLHIIF